MRKYWERQRCDILNSKKLNLLCVLGANLGEICVSKNRVSDDSGKPTVSDGASEGSVDGTRTCSGRSDPNEEMEDGDHEGGAGRND